MATDVEELCARHGLVHTGPDALSLRRFRCGRGFRYVHADGTPLRDAALRKRIDALAIPPAWTEVCIADDPKSHLQAIGRDDAGRLQYRYHPDWQQARAETKAERLLRFGEALPRIRRAVARELRRDELTRAKVTAAVVRLIDRALLRPGGEEYARDHGARGAATLLKRDVTIDRDRVSLKFNGKGGKPVRRTIRDRLLARVLQQLSGRPGPRLFTFGKRRHVRARDVNEFLSDAAGVDISAKDFRTFHASAEALALLAETEAASSKHAQNQAVIAAADHVSDELANTRAVARSSYIHPGVIDAFESDELDPRLLKGRARKGLSKTETALMRFLTAAN